jgi:outer membrane protein OmpA-like peptidoglycan-associated protein
MNQMLLGALAALGAGAVAGIFLAVRHFLRKRLPVWVAVLHGLGGATGFSIVLLIVVRNPDFALARQALYLLIATVALGSVNLLFHIRGVRHRTSLIIMHALTAVSGVSTLLYALIFPPPSAPAAPAAPVQPVASSPALAAASPAPSAQQADAAPSPPASASAAEPVGAASTSSAGELQLDPQLKDTLARTIGFAPRSAEILEESQPSIVEMAKALAQHPEVSLLQVQGHADERGADVRNIELTQRRAAAVVDALVQHGVQRARLHSVGFGARCPVDSACRDAASAPARCHAAEQWQLDRRVVLVALKVGSSSFAGELACPNGAALIPPADRAFHKPAG